MCFNVLMGVSPPAATSGYGRKSVFIHVYNFFKDFKNLFNWQRERERVLPMELGAGWGAWDSGLYPGPRDRGLSEGSGLPD